MRCHLKSRRSVSDVFLFFFFFALAKFSDLTVVTGDKRVPNSDRKFCSRTLDAIDARRKNRPGLQSIGHFRQRPFHWQLARNTSPCLQQPVIACHSQKVSGTYLSGVMQCKADSKAILGAWDVAMSTSESLQGRRSLSSSEREEMRDSP